METSTSPHLGFCSMKISKQRGDGFLSQETILGSPDELAELTKANDPEIVLKTMLERMKAKLENEDWPDPLRKIFLLSSKFEGWKYIEELGDSEREDMAQIRAGTLQASFSLLTGKKYIQCHPEVTLYGPVWVFAELVFKTAMALRNIEAGEPAVIAQSCLELGQLTERYRLNSFFGGDIERHNNQRNSAKHNKGKPREGSVETLTEMEAIIAKQKTKNVSQAARVAHQRGLGRSECANRSLWKRHRRSKP